MKKYTEITDPVELFRLHKEGKKIEIQCESLWLPWPGIGWGRYSKFRLVEEEEEQVPHWHAVVQTDPTSLYLMTSNLFTDADESIEYWGDQFIRLATEYPPIMLPRRKS
jgi:hypothetical protein